MNVKTICGALVAVVMLASGTAAAAQSATAQGQTTQATVATLSGNDALAYLPAYRKLLQQQLKSSDVQQRASATDVLHKLDQHQLKTFQVQIKSPGEMVSTTSLLPASSATIYPSNPINGETLALSSCSYDPKYTMFFQTTQEYAYFSNKHEWILVKSDSDRVAACAPA